MNRIIHSNLIYLQIFSYIEIRKNIYFIVNTLSVISRQFNILAKKLILRNQDIYSTKYLSTQSYNSDISYGDFDFDIEQIKKKDKRRLIFNLYWANRDDTIKITDINFKMKNIEIIKKHHKYIKNLLISVDNITGDTSELHKLNIGNLKLTYNMAQKIDFSKFKLERLYLSGGCCEISCENIHGLDKAQIKEIDISNIYQPSNIIEQLSNNIYLKVLKLLKYDLEIDMEILKKNKTIKEIIIKRPRTERELEYRTIIFEN